MKRTIEEVVDLLEQKRENAKLEIDRLYLKAKKSNQILEIDKVVRLKGEYDAYTDVIYLIASSHLLNRSE